MGHLTGFVVVQMGSLCGSEEFMAVPVHFDYYRGARTSSPCLACVGMQFRDVSYCR